MKYVPARACVLACFATFLLAGCSLLGDGAAWRRAIVLDGTTTIQRSARVEQLVAQMDAENFPRGGALRLKLSYELDSGSKALVALAAPASAKRAL